MSISLPDERWQPVATAPRDGTWFATFTPGEDACTTYDLAVFDVQDGTFCKIGCGFDWVTHWLPLARPGAAPGIDHG